MVIAIDEFVAGDGEAVFRGRRSSIISISLIVGDDRLKAQESWDRLVVETRSPSVEEADEIHRLGHPSSGTPVVA
jgi:hypothetical protein